MSFILLHICELVLLTRLLGEIVFSVTARTEPDEVRSFPVVFLLTLFSPLVILTFANALLIFTTVSNSIVVFKPVVNRRVRRCRYFVLLHLSILQGCYR